nr:protein UL31 [Mastomys natalensis cytomegalovirus 3]WEG70283.1 protein UL31 [Mastomys natalensis cytomegalovirus 3]WEG70423.1 protein UL31 [Mastomys natalensis cytomegalovirus 3]WEG70563.1 protein UL31 [Mastomys natalensis cytomegalovirus 3]WEG70843.1 protein UL31 [Mastomys natalensis cytomegalovirus 3]
MQTQTPERASSSGKWNEHARPSDEHVKDRQRSKSATSTSSNHRDKSKTLAELRVFMKNRPKCMCETNGDKKSGSSSTRPRTNRSESPKTSKTSRSESSKSIKLHRYSDKVTEHSSKRSDYSDVVKSPRNQEVREHQREPDRPRSTQSSKNDKRSTEIRKHISDEPPVKLRRTNNSSHPQSDSERDHTSPPATQSAPTSPCKSPQETTPQKTDSPLHGVKTHQPQQESSTELDQQPSSPRTSSSRTPEASPKALLTQTPSKTISPPNTPISDAPSQQSPTNLQHTSTENIPIQKDINVRECESNACSLHDILDPERSTTVSKNADQSQNHCGPMTALKHAIDMSSHQPSIIVGAPNAPINIDGGDFHAPVVVLHGSQATVLDTAIESLSDTCTTLIMYTNSIDAACPDARVKAEMTTRRNISNYRYRLMITNNQYNSIVPPGMRGRYHKGMIHFSTTVVGNPFRTADGTLCSWSNIFTPRVTIIPGGYFLLCSMQGSAAVCQPVVTQGGSHTALVAYEPNNVPPDNKMVTLGISAVFFVPYTTPEYGVRILPAAGLAGRLMDVRLGIMTPVRRTGNVYIALFSALTWIRRTTVDENGQPFSSYIAWFQCTQENAYTLCKFWYPGRRAIYECGEHEASINIETLYVSDDGKKLFGTLTVGNDNVSLSDIPPDMMPSMLVLRFEMKKSTYRDPFIIFNSNPTSHLSWPIGVDTYDPIIVYAAYDLVFKDGKHTYRVDFRFSKTRDRCFLISCCPSEFRFYTGLTLWKHNAPLSFVMLSPISELRVPRGTPIAHLHLIHNTDGDIYQNNYRTTMRLVNTTDGPHLYVGDLRLPQQNFVCYDEL